MKDIQWRLRLIYLVVCLFGLIIMVRAFSIGVIQRETWLAKKEHQTMKFQQIEAVRGNLYSSDGSLLATSLPIYTVRMDMKAENLKKIFLNEVDSLALCMSRLFPEKSATEYRTDLRQAFREGNRYYLLKKDVRHNELKEMKTFPILRKGRFKGGMIVEQHSRREMPFRHLALRTLGQYREGIKPVGIEGAYNEELKGTGGKRLMQKISGGVWKPVNDENEVEPREGHDIVTTIDIGIQDVAEAELMRQLKKHNAQYGSAILMEVQTGYIRAIANLGRGSDSLYYEDFNYAIGNSTEPGSTFKLASLMALFEDGLATPEQTFNTNGGVVYFRKQAMKDSHEGGFGTISLARAFELSSNTAISLAVDRAYSSQPQKFIDRLRKFHLHEPTGTELPGESAPLLKDTKDPKWSGITLPWMSIGYEVMLSPLQLLTFYNAVANDGKMVKPQFVQEIRHRGQVIRKFDPVVIDPAICSKATIDKVKPLLEGVVERGTATNLRNSHYKIAGKTGTALIAAGKDGYKGQKKYLASFAGYFPADNPRYTCVVVVYAPSNSAYYGNVVAGPVFKEVADKVYAQSIDIQSEVPKPFAENTENIVPRVKAGRGQNVSYILSQLGFELKGVEEEWVKVRNEEGALHSKPIAESNGLIPDVTGMGLRDALYLLENKGLRVRVLGKGTVRRQSLQPGTRLIKNNVITLELT